MAGACRPSRRPRPSRSRASRSSTSSASLSASSPSLASATSARPACLLASMPATLRLMNTASSAKSVRAGGREVAPARADAQHHVGLARRGVGGGGAGVADRAERLRVVVGQRALARLRLAHADPRRLRELAQRVRRLGVDRPAAGRRSAAGARPRISSAAAARTSGSGSGRRTRQTRRSNSSSANSNASACTSCGSASVTAPVSAGSVSTRIAASSAGASCSGRSIRVQNFETGRSVSLTDVVYEVGSSSSCRTVPAARVANTSPASSRTGSRLIVASAAPVTMLVAPGPTTLVHASICRRFFIRAYAAAAWTMPCSLRAR